MAVDDAPRLLRQILNAGAALLLVAGCTSAQDYVDRYGDPRPRLAELPICHGYGCRVRTIVRIEPEAWAGVARVFEPAPSDAAEERARLARAVALLEVMIGVAIVTLQRRR